MNGLLIDYNFCTGCHSCEMACKAEHGFDQLPDGSWEYNFIPTPTDRCDLCAERVEEGRLPTCVHHCQGLCMYFGPVEDLARKMTSSHMVLFTPCES